MSGLSRQEVDAIANLSAPPFGVIHGLQVLRPASGLTATSEAGLAVLRPSSGNAEFQEFAVAAASNVYTASRDTYVYLTNAGALAYSTQTNGAARPSLASLGAANGIMIALVISDASNITSVLDLRPLAGASLFTVPLSQSFAASAQGAVQYPVPQSCRLVGLSATATTALAGTDAGTITAARISNGVSTNIAGATLSFAASAAIGTRLTAVPTLASNPVFKQGDYFSLTPAKTTAGGVAEAYAIFEKL